LLANLVHEWGTPLGALNSAIKALQTSAAGQTILREDLIAGMTDQVHHLRRLLDDLARLYDHFLGTLRLSFERAALSERLPPRC
jgi:signal transduction histidine kinase